MKAKFQKFNSVVMFFTLLLLFAGAAFATRSNYANVSADKIIENILENDPVLLGLFLLDVLLIVVRVRKFFRSLIITFFAAYLILVIGPFFLAKTGLLNSTALSRVLYVYAGAVFLLCCRRKSKKQQQQTDTQDQNQHQEQPSANQHQTQSVINEQTTTTPPQPNKPKKSKTITFVVLIIVFGTALQGFQKFAKHLEEQARSEASLPKDEAARKRVEQAKKLIKRAENGDDDAQLRLAISLMEMEAKGIGDLNYAYYFPINDTLAQALSFLKKSYEQGNVEAQFLLAFSYFMGKIMQGDNKEERFKLMKPIAEKDPATIKKVYGIADKDGNKPYSSPEEMVALAQFVIAANYHVEYNNLFAEYTHKMSNLLCLYRSDIYSAFITANGRLNVRDAKGTRGKILFQVTKQNNILLVDTSPKRDSNGNRWYRVRFVYDKSANSVSSVNEGYVMGKYINVEGSVK